MNTEQVLMIGVLLVTGIALYGLLMLRNLFRIVIALQILMKGVVIALVAAGSVSGNMQLGQSMAVTVIVADTVVAVIALALTVQVQRRFGTVDTKALSTLKR